MSVVRWSRAGCARRAFPTRRSSDLVETHRCADAAAVAAREAEQAACQLQATYAKAMQWAQLTAKLNEDRKSTRLNSSHVSISYAVFCLKKKIVRRTGAPS